MKKCPNPHCGADVLDIATKCPKCGQSLVDIRHIIDSTDYRSRWILLFQFLIGHDTGRHLRWLGFDAQADEVVANNKQHFLSLFSCILEMFKNPVMGVAIFFNLIIYSIKESIEMFAIIFGRYSEDAQGRPVRYFKPYKRKKAPITPKLTLTNVDFSKNSSFNGIAEIGSTESVASAINVESSGAASASRQDINKLQKGAGLGVPLKNGLKLTTDVSDVNETERSSNDLKNK